jgi:hypothetical protein
MKVEINEYESTVTMKYAAFEVFVLGVVLNTSARLGIKIFDIQGKVIDSKQLMMEGEDYEGWGSDDQYIIDFVCRKLGFTLKPDEEETKQP